MKDNVEAQNKAFEVTYGADNSKHFDFNFTKDKLIRYIRDRRLNIALKYLYGKYSEAELKTWSVLIVCGGVGGEGVFFAKAGFKDVTTSDFSNNTITVANAHAPELKAMVLNAEAVDLPANSYDLVVVQDGLHHLPRPVLGFTEMLRVAKKAIIVLEPYDSLVGNSIGTEWEVIGDAVNYVYRWNRKMVQQAVKSYLLQEYDTIKVFRLWNHNTVIHKITKKFPVKFNLGIAKAIYSVLSLINFSGNAMVAVVTKKF